MKYKIQKICSLSLSAVLFGTIASFTFYGVGAARSGSEWSTATIAWPEQAAYAAPYHEENMIQTVANASAIPNSGKASQSLDVTEVAASVMPTMVSITNISVSEVQSYFGKFDRGQIQTKETESCGSGIIMGENDSELLIVSNNHVVDGANTLTVCFIDDAVVAATVKGCDSDNDLAVVAVKLKDIPDTTMSVIRAARVGDSDSLKVGQQVVAIGNALGYGQAVTTGIVSALNRQLGESDVNMIQTDAAINPGNSGGALLNMAGEVIGINSAKFSSTEVEGMGYAIAVSDALPIIQNLMNRTTREKVSAENAAYIGISGEDVTSSIEYIYGIPQGIYVTAVQNNSPAGKAGITTKTVITHFDGIRVTSLSNLKNRLEYYAAGETVELTVQVVQGNRYVEKKLKITLGSASKYNQSLGTADIGYKRSNIL